MTGSFSVINGGSSQVTVTAGSAFSRIYLSVSGVDGYFQVDLTGPATSSGLLITVARGIRVSNFNLVVGVEDASGAAGASVTQNLSVTSVGAGQVQVSVQWDSTSDVDLHVIDPTGEEIYYANAVGANGTLDLDSNAGCSPLDGVNNENITFPKPAPHGTYTVRVDYWDSCTFGGTSYVVTVQREGAAPLTFQGSFTGPGDKGGPGSGTQITTFTFP